MLTFGLYFSINTRTARNEEKEACVKMKLGDTYKTGRERENVVFPSRRTETTARERERTSHAILEIQLLVSLEKHEREKCDKIDCGTSYVYDYRINNIRAAMLHFMRISLMNNPMRRRTVEVAFALLIT